jgi:hypothetical protein
MAWNPSYRAPRAAEVLDPDATHPPELPRTSETERALLDAVLADPDADEPRLAYAAWARAQSPASHGWTRINTDENNHLIQSDPCLSVSIRGSSSFFSACGAKDLVVRRGFVEGMSLSGRAFISLGERIQRLTPLREVRLVAIQPFVGELARCPHLAKIRRLDLRGDRIGRDGVKELAASAFLGGLRELGLSGNDLGPEGLKELLAAGWASNLTAIELADNGLDSVSLAGFANLTSLDLSGNPLGPDVGVPSGLRRLVLSRCGLGQLPTGTLGSLRELDLSFNALGPVGAADLADDTALSQLRVLDLGFSDVESAGAVALCGAEAAGRLEVLNLRGNRITEPGARALADADFGLVVELDLGTNPIGEGGAVSLVRGEAFTSLERLSLANCGITDAGVRGLVATGALGGLRELSVAWNPLGDAGVKVIAACPDLAGLRHLDLTGTRLGFAGAVALADSPHLVSLRSVALGENHRLPADAVTMIRERYNAPS